MSNSSMPLVQLRLAGFGLLAIGVINLLLRSSLSPTSFTSPQARLALAQGLAAFAPWLLLSLSLVFVQGNRQRRSRESLPITLLHRLLLPLVVGYLLLVPLMVRDAIGFNRSVESQIERQVALYRTGSKRVQEQIRPLRTPLEVARTLQQYPNISVVADPADTAEGLKRKLTEALQVGEGRLRGRLDELRRSSLEGLAQRILQSSLVCLVAAAGLAVLRHQNLAVIEGSGHSLASYFHQDLLPERRGRRRLVSGYPKDAFPYGWIAEDAEVPQTSSTPRS